jgi:O-antigen ligase
MLIQKGSASVGVITFTLFVGLFFIFSFLGLPVYQSVVYVLAAIFFIIAFLNTDIALILIILSMLLSPEIRAGSLSERNVLIRAEDIFLFVIFFGWLSKMAINKELGLIKRTPLNSLMIFYIFICLVSSAIGIISGNTDFRRSIFYNLKYFEYFLIFFMVSNNLKSLKQAKIFVFFILLTCAIVCVMAWSQIPSGERLSAPFESEGGEPNTFAAYLLLMIGLGMGLFLYIRRKSLRFALFGLLILSTVAFVLTLSREAWLGFFPMFLVFIIMHKRLRYPLILVLLVFVAFLPFWLPKKVHERFQDAFAQERSYTVFGKKISVSESTAARIDTWSVALKHLSQKPVLGSGVPTGSVIDNQYTRVLIETGLAGFLVFMGLLLLLFRNTIYLYREVSDPFVKGLSLGFLAGFVGLLFQSFGAAVFILIRVMEPFWLLAAIVIALPGIQQQEQEGALGARIPE